MAGHMNTETVLNRWKPVEVTLQDGCRVLVRPVLPKDKALIEAGLSRLSERSRYIRFRSSRSGFSKQELEYLTELDYDTHFAWGAESLEEPKAGVAVARYVRDPEDPVAAEVAVTVVDEYQRLGLGETLIRFLAVSASINKIERLVGEVLPENDGAMKLFRRLGGETSETAGAFQRIALPLPLGAAGCLA
jgi:ribosomal protein S18 acetylase RimI-like enzyme